MYYNNRAEFSELVGKILTSVVVGNDNDTMTFWAADGDAYMLYHEQDCCESVSIEDIVGDLDDLIGSPILMAEEVTNADEPEGVDIKYRGYSETWTFYKLATIKGYVTIRWYGSSNGWYSESVDFCKLS
jgi:hypothetical protein